MEKRRSKKDNECFKALESVDLENKNLQKCLRKIMAARKLLEGKSNSVENHLSSLSVENDNLQNINVISCSKIQAVENEISQYEAKQKTLKEALKILKTEIKDYKGSFDTKMDKFTAIADKLCICFLFFINNGEVVEEEYLKRLEINKIKEQIVQKENNISEIKRELEEFIFYGFLENPIESLVQIEEKQFVMSIVEDELINARNQLEDLNRIKTEKEFEEYEVN